MHKIGSEEALVEFRIHSGEDHGGRNKGTPALGEWKTA